MQSTDSPAAGPRTAPSQAPGLPLGLSLLAGVLCLLWLEWLKRLPWGRRWMRG